MFARLAQDKFVRNGPSRSVTDAFERLIFTCPNLKKVINAFDNPEDWRRERFNTKEVQIIFTVKEEFLQTLFEYVSELKYKKSLKNRLIALNEI